MNYGTAALRSKDILAGIQSMKRHIRVHCATTVYKIIQCEIGSIITSSY